MTMMAASRGMAEAVFQMSHLGPAPIDHAYLARFTLGNLELEQEVLDLFAQSAPAYVESLKGADSLRAWREAAHTLKGSARSVGARAVAALAEQAEQLEGAGDPAAGAVVEALSASVDDVRAYIAGLVAAR